MPEFILPSLYSGIYTPTYTTAIALTVGFQRINTPATKAAIVGKI